MSDSDTYQLRLMHCPICGGECTHRAVMALPRAKCPRCKGAHLMEFMYNKREPTIWPVQDVRLGVNGY